MIAQHAPRAVQVVVEEGPPADAMLRMAVSFDLIVLSMPPHSDTHFGAIAQVLKECVHPVLFVPSTDEIFERSLS